jgi:hypothetical protein
MDALQAVRIYTVHDLPPKSSVLYSIDAFFDHSYALVYIYEREEIDCVYN